MEKTLVLGDLTSSHQLVTALGPDFSTVKYGSE